MECCYREIGERVCCFEKNASLYRGQMMLIKSTLSNHPTYYLSLFPIPKRDAWCIEKLQRDFYGVGLEMSLNSTWLLGPFSGGGLGIQNLF